MPATILLSLSLSLSLGFCKRGKEYTRSLRGAALDFGLELVNERLQCVARAQLIIRQLRPSDSRREEQTQRQIHVHNHRQQH
jgi:hypothetical protein